MIWKSTFIWDHLQRHGMKLSRSTQRLLKALQPQYKTASDLSSFIISLGDQGATFVTHVCHPCVSQQGSSLEGRTEPSLLSLSHHPAVPHLKEAARLEEQS